MGPPDWPSQPTLQGLSPAACLARDGIRGLRAPVLKHGQPYLWMAAQKQRFLFFLFFLVLSVCHFKNFCTEHVLFYNEKKINKHYFYERLYYRLERQFV